MEPVGRDHRPETTVLVDGNGSRSPQKKEGTIGGRKKAEEAETGFDTTSAHHKRDDVHRHIEPDDQGHHLPAVPQTFDKGVVFKGRTGFSNATMGTGWLIAADKPAAIGTEKGCSWGSSFHGTSMAWRYKTEDFAEALAFTRYDDALLQALWYTTIYPSSNHGFPS